MTDHEEGRPQLPGKEGMEAALRAALGRLQLGTPEHPRNRDLLARAARLHGRPVLNVRMLCRESGLSPTTVYRHFPWAVGMLAAGKAVAVPASAVPSSPGEVIAHQAQQLKVFECIVGVLRAEVHQVTQANIALHERLQGVEQARQAAIDAGRRRKEGVGHNVTPLQR